VESFEVMNVENFVDVNSAEPAYYDSAYYLAPDGASGHEVSQILRKAIGRTGRAALSQVVIGQRERVIIMRLYGNGLAAHTLHEQRHLNDASGLFEHPGQIDEGRLNWQPLG
jgi:DNA end-binding protein Ku